jgi:hypothetical protein
MNSKQVISGLFIGGLLLTGVTFAAKKHVPHHPRVNQVNRRENRIGRQAKNADLNAAQKARLQKQKHAFNKEEQTMRKADNGHLTKADQKALNQQLNKGHREVKRMDNRNDKSQGSK